MSDCYIREWTTFVWIMEEPQYILLFDGECHLCDGTVQFVLDRDKDERFHFCSLQSERGQAYLKQFELPTDVFDSFVLIEKDRYFLRSTAVLRLCMRMRFPWTLLSVFLIVPSFIRDFFYRIVAKNRYRWFGKLDSCRLPDPKFRSRFLQ